MKAPKRYRLPKTAAFLKVFETLKKIIQDSSRVDAGLLIVSGESRTLLERKGEMSHMEVLLVSVMHTDPKYHALFKRSVGIYEGMQKTNDLEQGNFEVDKDTNTVRMHLYEDQESKLPPPPPVKRWWNPITWI